MTRGRSFSGVHPVREHSSLTGFTLIELLVSVLILATCLTGIALTFINSFVLTDMSRDITLASNAVQSKLENLAREPFSNLTQASPLAGTFNLTDYGFPNANSKGRVYIQEDFGGYTDDLTRLRVVACFQSRGKLVGDNLTNCSTSSVEVVTLRSK